MEHKFHWHLAGLDQQRFSALINLLFIRQGGQVEPKLSLTEAQPPALTASTKLKARFLDRFAELISRERGAEYVSCTMLRERDGSVEIWVSRNSGTEKLRDETFFRDFERIMGRVRDRECATLEDDLWSLILEFYRPRLLHYVGVLAGSGDPRVRDIQPLVFRSRRSGWDIESLSQVIDLAFQIIERRRNGVGFGTGMVSESHGWMAVKFLARVRRGHNTFLACARKFRSFRQLTIVPIRNEKDKYSLGGRPWSLERVFNDALCLRLSNENTSRYISRRHNNTKGMRDVSWARSEFINESGKYLHVHAEIRLLLSILQSCAPLDEFTPYLGCSKDNCYMCSLFLSHFGNIATRGTHSRVYNRWTIPDTLGLPENAVQNLMAVIRGIESDMIAELRTPIGFQQPRYYAQSTVGKDTSGSSPMTESTIRPVVIAAPVQEDAFLPQQSGSSTASANEEDLDATPRQQSIILLGSPIVNVDIISPPSETEDDPLQEREVLELPLDSESEVQGSLSMTRPIPERQNGNDSECAVEGITEEPGIEDRANQCEDETPKAESSETPSIQVIHCIQPDTGRTVSKSRSGYSRDLSAENPSKSCDESDALSTISAIFRSPSGYSGSTVPHTAIPTATPEPPELDAKPVEEIVKNRHSELPTSEDRFRGLPNLPQNRAGTSSSCSRAWEHLEQYLMDSVKVVPDTLFRDSLETIEYTGYLNELSLTVWILQTYKRFLRKEHSESDGEVSSLATQTPRRLFIPPNAARVIENALWSGYQGYACRMMCEFWEMVGGNGELCPDQIVFITEKDRHWTVYCIDTKQGAISSYGSSHVSEWGESQVRAWWSAVESLWILSHTHRIKNRSMSEIYSFRYLDSPGGESSTMMAAVWYKLLTGIPINKSIDLLRLRDLIRREVSSVLNRKLQGNFKPKSRI